VRIDNSKITLNGYPVLHCVMADEEEGVVHAYATDETGRLILHDGCPIVNYYRGVVHINGH
jgi:hypothetical protein